MNAEINRKIENSTRCKIVTPENFNSKLSRRGYIVDDNSRANVGAKWFSGG